MMEYDYLEINFPITNIINILHVSILLFLYFRPLSSGSTALISAYIQKFIFLIKLMFLLMSMVF